MVKKLSRKHEMMKTRKYLLVKDLHGQHIPMHKAHSAAVFALGLRRAKEGSRPHQPVGDGQTSVFVKTSP
jgi:hypothetical protein